MERKITVKGTGQISLKPDLIVLDLRLDSLDMNYERALALATRSVEGLTEVLARADFTKDDLKTTNYNVTTQYRSQLDKNEQYIQVFEGYLVHHELKLEFEFDQARLTKTLGLIAGAEVMPGLGIRFSIRDQSAVSEELLLTATTNARRKAEILAGASGVALGELLLIEYDWGEFHLYSPTNYAMEDSRMLKMAALAPEITPENISLSDHVTFVWALS